MQIVFRQEFKKQYRKLRTSERKKAQHRLRLFEENPYNPVLRNHELKGKYVGYYSINISGDLRALYQLVHKDVALFITIDTHSNLYE